MSEQTTTTDKMEAIKFVLGVLQEHEKELDRLVSKLTVQLREAQKMTKRIDKIDEKVENLREELSVLVKCIRSNR